MTTLSETKSTPVLSYFYDGSLLLAEKVGSQIQKIYINDGQGIVGMVRPIYNESNTLTHYQRLYYLFDSLGSVSAVTGEHGLPLQNYTYSPFGTCLNVTGDPINNLQFIGRYGGYLDNDTGLTYFWHRWYDSGTGRFISRDPIGTCSDANLYRYVKNNSLNYVDATGQIMTGVPPVDIVLGILCIKKEYQEHKRDGKNDKVKHCNVAGNIYAKCGLTAALVASFGKELMDLVGPGNAEWADIAADFKGINCADKCKKDSKDNDDSSCSSKPKKPGKDSIDNCLKDCCK